MCEIQLKYKNVLIVYIMCEIQLKYKNVYVLLIV